MLFWRVITALILIPFVIAGTLMLPALWFTGIVGVVFVLAAWEWAALCYPDHVLKKGLLVGIFILLALAVLRAHIDNPLTQWYVWAVGAVFWLAALWWVCTYKLAPPCGMKSAYSRALAGYAALVPAFFSLVFLQQIAPLSIIVLFIIIWSTDTFAYFAGRKWGKRALAPQVSPKKTWEGFWGGLVGAWVLTAGILWPGVAGLSLQYVFICVGIIVIILWGVLGDLFESLLKRIAGVKDSGTLLPGHGGLLDRLDSLIAALPFYAAGIAWFHHIGVIG